MRASRTLLVCLAVAALAAAGGCMRHPAPQPIVAAPAPVVAAPMPDFPPAVARPPMAAVVAARVVAARVGGGPAAAPPYRLDAGDKLRVIVFGQENLSNSYAVDAGGYITMPLIGTVKARDLTAFALSSEIAGKLR